MCNGMKGVEVEYKDGNKKMYNCTGYDVKNFTFDRGGKALALYLFKGKGKKAVKLRMSNIKTWRVVKD